MVLETASVLKRLKKEKKIRRLRGECSTWTAFEAD